jgi:hypothetical protein
MEEMVASAGTSPQGTSPLKIADTGLKTHDTGAGRPTAPVSPYDSVVRPAPEWLPESVASAPCRPQGVKRA